MFWACFSYDKNCHCWKPTAKEKAAALKDIERMNEEMEPACREAWELNNEYSVSDFRELDVPLKWRFNASTGKLSRGGGWY